MAWSEASVVLIGAGAPGPVKLVGTGVVVAKGRVLTARHVALDKEGQPKPGLVVRREGGSWSPPATVAWPGADGLDVAVLGADGEAGPAPPLFEIRDLDGGEAWVAHGYPAVREKAPSERLEQVRGEAGRYRVGGARLDLDVGAAPKLFNGMSGAPVVVGGQIVGVLRAVPEGWDGHRLEATPVAAFVYEASFREALGLDEKSLARLVAPDPILIPGTSDLPKLAGAAALLNARHEVVGFHGREELLEEMRAWCESEDDVRARLIHAEGGMGKTRLAIELCGQMRAKGWRAGFLQEGRGLDELLESERPVLVAIDYAESRADLRDVLKRTAGSHRNKALRVVLLARNAADWWADLPRKDRAVEDLLAQEEPRALAQVTPDRAAIFREAVEEFAKRLNKKAPEGATPSLEDPRYQRVLYVHAAALATVEGDEVKIETLLGKVLDHEEDFWWKQLSELAYVDQRVAVPEMRRAVAALTLTGGASSEAEVKQLTGDKKMAMLLHDLYPGRAPKYVAGLEPDLLGEAMVWRALNMAGVEAESYLDRVFDCANAEAIRTGFTVLGRLSEDHKEAAAWIGRMLAVDVAGRAMAALAAAKAVGERTAHSPLGIELAKALARDGTVELAKQLGPELPGPQHTVSLLEVGLWVLGKVLQHLSEDADPQDRAGLLNNLSIWQSELGQRKDALASAREAAGIYRKLAESRPEAFLPDLAMSLNNTGVMQGEFGQHEAALASAREAVDIYRELADAHPEAFLPDLAMNLNNLGIRQSELGQREEALASTQEAVDIRRILAQSHPEAFLPDLATSLNNLGGRQNEFGRHEAALASTQEAVEIFRELAESHPEAFLLRFTASLNNLGMMHSALGQHEAALVSSQAAVGIYRKLVESRPEAFLDDLARSLYNLGNTQSALGQHEEALASLHEALDMIWLLFLAQPVAIERDAGAHLGNLFKRLAAAGRTPSPELLQRVEEFEAILGASPGDPDR